MMLQKKVEPDKELLRSVSDNRTAKDLACDCVG